MNKEQFRKQYFEWLRETKKEKLKEAIQSEDDGVRFSYALHRSISNTEFQVMGVQLTHVGLVTKRQRHLFTRLCKLHRQWKETNGVH